MSLEGGEGGGRGRGGERRGWEGREGGREGMGGEGMGGRGEMTVIESTYYDGTTLFI